VASRQKNAPSEKKKVTKLNQMSTARVGGRSINEYKHLGREKRGKKKKKVGSPWGTKIWGGLISTKEKDRQLNICVRRRVEMRGGVLGGVRPVGWVEGGGWGGGVGEAGTRGQGEGGGGGASDGAGGGRGWGGGGGGKGDGEGGGGGG